MKKLIKTQFWLLLLGTLFAWGNFSYEMIGWLRGMECTTGCASAPNPFLTPCFYGALFFLAAFVLNVMILKKSRHEGAGEV